jgi:hypothetical protein
MSAYTQPAPLMDMDMLLEQEDFDRLKYLSNNGVKEN